MNQKLFKLFSLSPALDGQLFGKVFSTRKTSKSTEVLEHIALSGQKELFVRSEAQGTEFIRGTYSFKFSEQTFSSFKDYLSAYLSVKGITLGQSKVAQGARLKDNFSDVENDVQILDIDWYSTELLSLEQIALEVLAKLGNPEADFFAIPSSSYGAKFEKGWKNAIRLFVFPKRQTLSEFSSQLPCSAEQKVLWGQEILDTKIYQPERMIFTVPNLGNDLYSERDSFGKLFSSRAERISGVSFETSQVPRAKVSTSEVKTRVAVAVSEDANGILERLLEAKYPSNSEVFQNPSAERHIEMLKAASFLKTLGQNLSLDTEQAWFSWGERTTRSLEDLKQLFRSAKTSEFSYNEQVLEWVSRNLPTTNTFSYLNIEQTPNCLALWCSMGTGKTVYTSKWIKERHKQGTKTLVVVPRQTLTKSCFVNLKKSLPELSVKHYKDQDAREGDVIITTIHSFDKFNTLDIEAVVVDEVIQVRKDLVSEPMLKAQEISRESVHGSGRSNAQIWNEILSTQNLLVCDAFMGETNFLEELKTLRSDLIVKKHITPFTKNVISCLDEKSFLRELLDRVEGGERCTIAFSSKKDLLNCAEILRDKGKKILTITGDLSKTKEQEEGISDPNSSWASYDAVLYTSAIASGVSFDVENHFDFVAGHFGQVISLSFSDQLQMIGRVRKPKTQDLLIFAANKSETTNFDLKNEVSQIYIERQLLDQNKKRPLGQDLLNKISGEISLESLKQLINEVELKIIEIGDDEHFDFYSQIIKEEISGKSLWRSHWNALASFFSTLDRFETSDELKKEVSELLSSAKKTIKENSDLSLEQIDTSSLPEDVRVVALNDPNRALSLLANTKQTTLSDVFTCRQVWLEANLPFIENTRDFLDEKGFAKAERIHDTLSASKFDLRVISKNGKEITKKNSDFLLSKDCRQTATLLLWNTLSEYISEHKDLGKVWKALQRLEKKYAGLFKILGHKELDVLRKLDSTSQRTVNRLLESFGLEVKKERDRKGGKDTLVTKGVESSSILEALLRI